MIELPHILLPVLVPFAFIHTALHFRKEIADAGAWIDRRLSKLRLYFHLAPPLVWTTLRSLAILIAALSILSHALIAALHVGASLLHA